MIFQSEIRKIIKMHKLIFLLTVFVFQVSSAQEKADESKVVVKLGALTPSLEFDAKDTGQKSPALDFLPSTQAKTLIGVHFKNYGFSLSAYNPRTSDFRSKHGDGKSIDFQLRYSYEDYYLESYYQQYKGYYLKNPEKILASPFGPNGEYPQNKGLKTEHYGIMIYKFLDIENFHPRRAFEMVDRPTKSGGSWYYSASANAHRMKTAESLVPAGSVHTYPGLENLRSISAYTIAGGAGGAYSYVFREAWVASALFGVSLGSQWIKSKYTEDTSYTNVASLKTQGKAALGYSGEQFLAALNLQLDVTQIKHTPSELAFRSVESTLFLGWRF